MFDTIPLYDGVNNALVVPDTPRIVPLCPSVGALREENFFSDPDIVFVRLNVQSDLQWLNLKVNVEAFLTFSLKCYRRKYLL